jgi:hypothetical protein
MLSPLWGYLISVTDVFSLSSIRLPDQNVVDTETLPSRRIPRGYYDATVRRLPTLRRQWEKVEVVTTKNDEEDESEDEDEDGEGEGTRLSVNGLETQHRKNHIF